jgi:hypothetical protein
MWVFCYHGMARPQVVDGGDGLQIWSVAANILSSREQPKGGGPPDGSFYEVLRRTSDLDGLYNEDLHYLYSSPNNTRN